MPEKLQKAARQVAGEVKEAILARASIEQVIAAYQLPICLSSQIGQSLFVNQAYDNVFSGDATLAGRHRHAYLSEDLCMVFGAAESMMLNGAEMVEFRISTRIQNQYIARVCSVQISLLGMSHSSVAFLTIMSIRPNTFTLLPSAERLRRDWRLFRSLTAFDRKCAKLLASQTNLHAIAATLEVSVRTIDNHRALILKQLSLNNVLELAKLVCRLEEAGYEE